MSKQQLCAARPVALALTLLFSNVFFIGQAWGLVININPGSGLASNSSALTAFQNAAAEWSSHISTPITVNINADLADLGNTGTIGSTSPSFTTGSYSVVRNAMVAHGIADPAASINQFLPTAAQFSATLPVNYGFTGNMLLTRANALALGFNLGAGTDATITFNSQFAFAYNQAQLDGSHMDFQSVAAHEIGHALGFVSAVDNIDTAAHNNTTGNISFTPLDMFRFSSANVPSTTTQFTTNPRDFVPGNNDYIDDTIDQLQLSTGFYFGDGRQASHWKDDTLTGFLLGIMDPTLSFGVSHTVGANDLRALELIGYTLLLAAVPEPSTLLLYLIGVFALFYFSDVRRKELTAIN